MVDRLMEDGEQWEGFGHGVVPPRKLPAMIANDEILGSDSGVENDAEGGVDGDSVIDCDGNGHVVPPKGPCPTERTANDAKGNDDGDGGGVGGWGRENDQVAHRWLVVLWA